MPQRTCSLRHGCRAWARIHGRRECACHAGPEARPAAPPPEYAPPHGSRRAFQLRWKALRAPPPLSLFSLRPFTVKLPAVLFFRRVIRLYRLSKLVGTRSVSLALNTSKQSAYLARVLIYA